MLEYVGRNRISSCVITSYKSDSKAKNINGSDFTIQLQVINRTASEYVATGAQLMSAQDADVGTKTGSNGQTKATTADGLKSSVSETISSSAYASYVSSYAKKPGSSSGPNTRTTPAYSAA